MSLEDEHHSVTIYQRYSDTDDNGLSLLGGAISNYFNDAVDSTTKMGIHVVVSSGNKYHDNACNYSPALSSSATTVGATEVISNAIADFTF
ncbi:12013_t:CDS:2 [Gigaspora margarita]|uniref:12013_t:CDS:1 n=1 Tax=Gigaspora margarita TaxID=4874 RepID=A0ABN7VE07_GIGMA|nr:12013_t:CDS:2 [Gigaspora margarita]